MANKDSLRNVADLPPEERKKFASAGGKASVEARRKKKQMRKQMEILLGLDVKSKKSRESMKALGIDEDDMNNQMALMVAMFKEAVNGNVNAFREIRDLIGENGYSLEEQKSRIELNKARTQAITGENQRDDAINKLDEILKEVRDNAIEQEAE